MFLNYFGEQRFGSTSDIQGNAANIGLQILKGDYVSRFLYCIQTNSMSGLDCAGHVNM